MSPEDFASFVALLGPKIVLLGDIYWSEVRAFFYRPLLPLTEYDPASVRAPFMSVLGGVQYPVPANAEANSYLNWLLFDQARDYSLASLDKNRRRQVKLAAKEFTIRPVTDVLEFKQQAHPVYLSFYERTRYKVGARRQDPVFFAEWADTLFRIKNVLILGAYRNKVLEGVSLSYRVNDTAYYATFFCNNDALERYLSDLMLHTVREAAAATKEVGQVFVGMYKGHQGLDDFYLLRGAKLVRQRAWLGVNPLTRSLLKLFLPRQYAQLLGQLPDRPGAPGSQISPTPDQPEADKAPSIRSP